MWRFYARLDMAQIISLLDRRRLSLGNEEYGRKMSIGADWGKVRLGVCFGVNSDLDGSIAGAEMVMGLSEGTDLMYKNVACRDFIGWHFGTAVGTATWTRNAAALEYYSFGNPDGYFISRVSGVTASTTSGGTGNLVSAAPAAYVMGAYLDIIKNSATSITLNFRRQTAATVTTLDLFLRAMEDETNYAGVGASTPTATIAYAGNSAWNSVDIAWNRDYPSTMEIAYIYVLRYQ